MKTKLTSCLMSVCFVLTAATLVPGEAHAAGTRHAAMHMGLGVATAVANLVYGPAKVLYAVCGSTIGGLAYVFTGGRADVARAIIQPSVRGDYALTPENLTMEEPFSFSGQDPEYQSYPQSYPR